MKNASRRIAPGLAFTTARSTARSTAIATALAAGLAAGLAACGGQRTVSTSIEGTRIPAEVLDALGPDTSARDWLVLHYGAPDRTEITAAGHTVLTWVYTREAREHRPDPHTEWFSEESHVEFDGQGNALRGWSDRSTRQGD